MKRMAWIVPALAFAACGGNGNTNVLLGTGGSITSGTGSSSGTASSSGTTSSTSTGGTGGTTTTEGCGSGCPTGTTCGTANGFPVCRAASGIPLFSHVFVIMMENTTWTTLTGAMALGQAPNLEAMMAKYATGTAYHGVTHPSLPNYIALTSGDTQSIVCDCTAQPGNGTCLSNGLACEAALLFTPCSCPVSATNIADQLETAGKTWMAFGESMGTPCNLVDSTTNSYAQRHVPFLYYEDIQTNKARCDAHVVDFSSFVPDSAASFNFIAPNLIDDMHNPDPTNSTNIPNGDAWIGPQVAKITASPSYTQGGLLVVLWDEDDGSGGLLENSDDPIGIYVISPYAKSGGYQSSVMANHYSLLATIEDGLGLSRLGSAANPGSGYAATLSDYFPAN